MKSFIKKQQFNYIKRCLFDLNNTFINCSDPNIINVSKLIAQDKILSCFDKLSEGEKEILNISKITTPLHIDIYLNDLKSIEPLKIFKKEKKLKIPNLDIKDKKLVYLGWIDEATKKLLITYNLNGNLLGMSCRLTESKPNSSNICTLCNHIGNSAEVGFVSPICKPKNQDDYKSLGFYICLNSDECNERITSTEKLETLIKIVNRLD